MNFLPFASNRAFYLVRNCTKEKKRNPFIKPVGENTEGVGRS